MATRRYVLAAGGGVVALGLLGYGGSAAWCRSAEMAGLPLERLDVALADIRGAERIGRAFRARMAETDALTVLRETPALLDAMEFDCPETRRAMLRQTFRAGFAQGDVITADRWVVSRAECIVAALRTA